MRYRTFTADEIDAIVAYCPANARSYYLPVSVVGERRIVRLRIAPAANNQNLAINWRRSTSSGL